VEPSVRDRIRRAGGPVRAAVRAIFAWKFIPVTVFFGAGLTLALNKRWGWSYFFFCSMFAWSLGSWLTSDTLARQCREQLGFKKRAEAASKAKRKCQLMKWGVSLDACLGGERFRCWGASGRVWHKSHFNRTVLLQKGARKPLIQALERNVFRLPVLALQMEVF
jgi:hypothetical protein